MRNIHVTPEPVTLEGFQAVLKPSKFGYSLKALVGEELISKLETERGECLKWAESKLKNPKRSTPLYSSAASDVYKRQGSGVTCMFLINRKNIVNQLQLPV